jgi:O-antigen/teichoic acid export membrane protein
MGEDFSEMIEKSARGSLVLMLGQMASTLISAIGVIIIARLLGSTSYGLISIAIIPVNVALLLINNGVTEALINLIAEDRHLRDGENVRNIIYTGLTINISAGLLTSLTLYLSASYLASNIFMRPELTPLIRILSLTTLAQALFNTMASVLVGFERMDHRSAMNIIYSILKSLIGPALVYLGYGVVGAAIGNIAPLLATGVIGVLLVIFNLRKTIFTGLNTSYFRLILSYSAPIFMSALISGVFIQGLNFILPLYASASAIGNLSAATNFNVLISFILTPISTAMFPLLSKLSPRDSVFQSVYNNIIKYEAIVAYPVAAGIIALSSRMVGALYGPDYQPATLYIQIIMLNYIFLGIGSTVNSILLNSQKRTDIQFRTTIIYLIVGIPMGVFFIPRYGVLGFQATTMLAPKLGLLYSILWIRKNLGISLELVSTVKIASSAILGYMACRTVLIILSFNVWIELFLGGIAISVTYMVSIMLTGALIAKNFNDIKHITDKNRLGKTLVGPILEYLIKHAKK